MSVLKKVVIGVVAVVLIASLSFGEEKDPPGRVARLNYLSGQVSVQPNGVDEWVAPAVNRPLTSSDRVYTDRDARAELQLGGAALRLNQETSMTLVNVNDNNVQVQLDQGTLSVHVVELFNGEVYEIDTPNVAFVVKKSGDYRFDVDNAGDTTSVTVFRGEGEATGDNQAVRIGKEERFTFTGGRSLQYTYNHNPGFDGFDDWCRARADREDRSASAQYVSRGTVGYSDLDYYGRWETVPTYGAIWVPANVGVGWAPYRYGHWVWISPWGWTWVDDSPWGFAPYHYGRWVQYNNYWGWCPGPRHIRPIYAPALVGWIGGPRWGVGLSFGLGGGVGWFPLGWGEPYLPYYRHSRGYFEHVNVTNTRITNITYVTNNYYGRNDFSRLHYRYRETPHAVTAVSNDVFRGGRPTRDGIVRVNEHELHDASFQRNVAVAPTTNSMLGVHAGEHRNGPPQVDRGTRVTHGNTMHGNLGAPIAPVTAGGNSSSGGPDRRVETGRPETGRPDRGGPDMRGNHEPAAGSTVVVDTRHRNVPRPPENGATAPGVDRGAGIGRGPRNEPPAEGLNNGTLVPSRVPHPPQDRDEGRTPPVRGGAEGGPVPQRSVPDSLKTPVTDHSTPDAATGNPRVDKNDPNAGGGSLRTHELGGRGNVPRPPDSQTIQPERRTDSGNAPDYRPAPRTLGERTSPRSEPSTGSAPSRNDNVTRPVTPAPREERPAPRNEPPVTRAPESRPEGVSRPSNPTPAPSRQVETPRQEAPRQAEPARPQHTETPRHVEDKVNRNTEKPQSRLGYPSPYNTNGMVRAASYSPRATAYPSPTSMRSDFVGSSRPSYSTTRSMSVPRERYSTSTRQSSPTYSSRSNYSTPVARSYSAPSYHSSPSYSAPRASYSSSSYHSSGSVGGGHSSSSSHGGGSSSSSGGSHSGGHSRR